MCMPSLRTMYETGRSRRPKTPHGSPHHPRPDRLKFFYFLACIHQRWPKINSLTFQLGWPPPPPGSRSNSYWDNANDIKLCKWYKTIYWGRDTRWLRRYYTLLLWQGGWGGASYQHANIPDLHPVITNKINKLIKPVNLMEQILSLHICQGNV